MESGKGDVRNSKVLLIFILVIVLAFSLVLVLKFVPLKYEEEHYYSFVVLQPQQTDSAWFIVPKGHTIDGSYWTSSDNPTVVQISYRSPNTSQNLTAYVDESYQGSFLIVANADAIDDKYTFNFENPASQGVLGVGSGPTITVTFSFKIYGMTTYL